MRLELYRFEGLVAGSTFSNLLERRAMHVCSANLRFNAAGSKAESVFVMLSDCAQTIVPSAGCGQRCCRCFVFRAGLHL
jgi:hypothetical protein